MIADVLRRKMNPTKKLQELVEKGFTVSYPIRTKGKSIYTTSNNIPTKKEKDLYVIIDEVADEIMKARKDAEVDRNNPMPDRDSTNKS